MQLDYRDVEGRASKHVIWPFMPGCFETTRMTCAWCQMRKDFRPFRSDRFLSAIVLGERFPERPSALRLKWRNAEVNGLTAEAGARPHTLK
jgi:predicted DNA-binding transcriptional regulator YafY